MKKLVLLVLVSCAGRPANPACGEDKLAAVVALCVADEAKQGCDEDPVRLCPELVKACEKRIDEWQACR